MQPNSTITPTPVPEKKTVIDKGAVIFAVSILSAFLILSILVAANNSKDGVAAAQEEKTKSDESEKIETFDVPAAQLARDFSVNELAAEKAYKHKSLKVFGTVASVGRDADGDPYVLLNGSGGVGIHCMLMDGYSVNLAADLYPGKKTFVKGYVKGLSSNVIMKGVLHDL